MITDTGGAYRPLTDDDKKSLEQQLKRPINDFKRNKLLKETKKNWDLFYKRNGVNFFKDRHWTVREFEELAGACERKDVLLEVGCGVGNFLFPLFSEKIISFAYACDISEKAIELVKQNPLCNENEVNAFQCDITKNQLSEHIPINSVDIASLIFVLSAIDPKLFNKGLGNINKILKPGGVLLFRDYGLYDMAQIRFGPGHKMGENWYVRQDGTFSYYFSKQFAEELFIKAGFEVEISDYVTRRTINKKENVDVERIFMQGKYRKK